MKSGFCEFPFEVVMFLCCLCVDANEMRVLWIAFGCSVVFRLSLCGCQINEGFVDFLLMWCCFYVVSVWLPMK